jgi:hypothetical protein
VTVDYNGEQAAPAPASDVIAKFLRGSFSVADVIRRAMHGWLFGLIGLALGLAFGVHSVWATPVTYSVSIGLLPTDSAGDISVGDSAGGGTLGALAGLLGMGGGPVPKFTRFVASLNATRVAKIMDQKYDMVCLTFRDCDPKNHTWRKHAGFDAWVQKTIANIAHTRDPDGPRTAIDLAGYTASRVVISSDRATKILTLTMEDTDPKFATLYLVNLVQATNDFIKNEDLSVVRPYVEYLTAQLASTSLNLAQHDALTALLVEQERRLMLSSVNVPYAASVQDGPNVTSANSALRMLATDALLGLLLGFAMGILRSLWRSRTGERSKSWQP